MSQRCRYRYGNITRSKQTMNDTWDLIEQQNILKLLMTVDAPVVSNRELTLKCERRSVSPRPQLLPPFFDDLLFCDDTEHLMSNRDCTSCYGSNATPFDFGVNNSRGCSTARHVVSSKHNRDRDRNQILQQCTVRTGSSRLPLKHKRQHDGTRKSLGHEILDNAIHLLD